MRVYLDESGDLGWTFSHPYRNGGSSRYLTIAYLFVPNLHKKKPKECIKSLYAKYKWASEKKAADATLNQKIQVAQLAAKLLVDCPDIKIDVITVKKENVQAHIRLDGNKLYNYMCALVVPDYLKGHERALFIPDKRSIKVESGNSLADYLQTKMWFELDIQTVLINQPEESSENYCLQFVDWVAHCVWIHYEDGIHVPFQLLNANKSVRVRELFF